MSEQNTQCVMETTSEFGALDQILVENNPEQEHDKGTEDKKEKDIGMHDASNDELLPARAQDREDKNYKTELVKQKHDLGNVEESSAADDCLRQHQTNMERPQDDYKELTYKLQKTLQQLSGVKIRLNKPGTNRSTAIYTRFQECWKQRQKKIEMLRLQKERQEYQQQIYRICEVVGRPKIDSHSEALAKELNNEPIYKRGINLALAKRNKIEEYNRQRESAKDQEEKQYLQQFHKKFQPNGEERDYQAYYRDMSKWKEKAWEKVKEKMKEKEGKEMEGATFKPAINPRSEKMMREKKRVPIQDRVIKKKGEGKGGWKSGKAEEKSEGKEHSINTRANRSMWG